MHPPQPAIFLSPQLQLPPNQPISPHPTQLSSQPITNPNNRAQVAHNFRLQTFPTYVIAPLPLHDIHLRYGKFLNKTKPTTCIWNVTYY